MELVDSHVHLDRYPDEDVRAMLSRAEAAGVRRLLTIGTDLATSRAALALAGRYPSVLAAVGVHPTRLGRLPSSEGAMNCAPTESANVGAQFIAPSPPEQQLTDLLDEIKPGTVAAIGEVGLDEHAPDLEGQRRFLAACLELAAQHRLPLVLHVVGAAAIHEAALAIVARHPDVRAVAHYFVGGPELAQRYVEAGCWISVGRPATRPSETAVRLAIPTIPLDRLLLETDTYPLPGRTTEPRDVMSVCAAVAELTGRSQEAIAAATTANFAAFIGRRE
jgi:TatD DNase family protein